jgi:hypothetical protein
MHFVLSVAEHVLTMQVVGNVLLVWKILTVLTLDLLTCVRVNDFRR